ncbi:NmrA family protein [Nitzschia inconspicua]|uniref:NmrA family protein n=1 Tax=Nitzschia inconspicua TaxID=303405 RepID=A0A9K3Q231_9STRA|nr:NmrA family protein [Nitzschia inconspicua]
MRFTAAVSSILYCVLLLIAGSDAFSTTRSTPTRTATQQPSSVLFSSVFNEEAEKHGGTLDRRSLFQTAAAATFSAAALSVPEWILSPSVASATTVTPSKVVVAGATGQTGRRVLERLAAQPGLSVIAGVRNVEKANDALQKESTVIRGAMVQKVASVDTSAVELKHLDVVKDSVDQLAATLEGADSLVIATGFVPSNPLKMNEAAHQVDNLGTKALVDAAKKAGVKKVVMVSSILTNGRNWGQEKSPGFVVTNAFGNVLDEKLEAELYLRKSGLDYTIVRPGGLKAKPPTGPLVISGEDTLNAGEISRDLVADVCVASLSDPKASNKVLEIIEGEEGGPQVFNGLSM